MRWQGWGFHIFEVAFDIFCSCCAVLGRVWAHLEALNAQLRAAQDAPHMAHPLQSPQNKLSHLPLGCSQSQAPPWDGDIFAKGAFGRAPLLHKS